AVATGRAGYVCLYGSEVIDWGIIVKATRNSADLVSYVQELISTIKPDVVVTEKLGETCRKGKRSRCLIQAIAELASHNPVLDVAVDRQRSFPSKYEEAVYLVGKHPDLTGYLPSRKRKFYEVEPRRMILFEAVVLAETVINGPPEQLAAAMG
ncbi:MAG: hypothetical protein AAF556_05335, partial [Pseudomonadota bacterium]